MLQIMMMEDKDETSKRTSMRKKDFNDLLTSIDQARAINKNILKKLKRPEPRKSFSGRRVLDPGQKKVSKRHSQISSYPSTGYQL